MPALSISTMIIHVKLSKNRKEYSHKEAAQREKHLVSEEEDQPNAVSQLRELLGWQSAKGNGLATAMRAKDKLQGFQRDPVV